MTRTELSTEYRNTTTKGHTMNTLKTRLTLATTTAAGLTLGLLAPAQAFEGSPTQPPGFGFINTLIGWALYIAAFVLFIFFIIGIVTAAKARRNGDQEITAPLWPLLGGAGLTIAGIVWGAVVGI